MNAKEQMLRNIGVVDFTLVELALFLDTHPGDRRALDYYNHYVRIKRQMCREFSAKYFPLTLSEVECEKGWSWGEAPLPWEGGCD